MRYLAHLESIGNFLREYGEGAKEILQRDSRVGLSKLLNWGYPIPQIPGITDNVFTYVPDNNYSPIMLAEALTQGEKVQVLVYQDRYIHSRAQIENLFAFIKGLQAQQILRFGKKANILKVVIVTISKSYNAIRNYLTTYFEGKNFGLKGGIFGLNSIPMVLVKNHSAKLPGERQFIFYKKLTSLEWEITDTKPREYWCYNIVWKATRSWDFLTGEGLAFDSVKNHITYAKVKWESALPEAKQVIWEVMPFLFNTIG